MEGKRTVKPPKVYTPSSTETKESKKKKLSKELKENQQQKKKEEVAKLAIKKGKSHQILK